MAEPSVEKPLLIKPKMVLHFPHILALVNAMPSMGGNANMIDALRLRGIATMWFEGLAKASSFMCPRCGSLWSTREKRDICPHTTRSGAAIAEQANAAQERFIRNWIELAQREIARG